MDRNAVNRWTAVVAYVIALLGIPLVIFGLFYGGGSLVTAGIAMIAMGIIVGRVANRP